MSTPVLDSTVINGTFAPDVVANLTSEGLNATALALIPGVNLTLILSDTREYCNLTICSLEELGSFTYVPTFAGNLIYLIIFAAIIPPQLFLGWKFKTWSFTVPLTIGVIGELVGYLGRVQMHSEPFAFNPFLIQLICLTIAPAFLSAALYLCLGRIVEVYSASISRIPSRAYTWIFVTCDFISLVLQAAGGAITATAEDDDKKTHDMGVNIMIAGLAFQVVSLLLFITLAGEYAMRLRRNWNARNLHMEYMYSSVAWKLFLFGLVAATFTIFTRCVYRVAELSKGFSSELANDELVFMILEGPMLIAACLGLTLFHPGFALNDLWPRKRLVAVCKGGDQAGAYKMTNYNSSRENSPLPQQRARTHRVV